MFSLSEGKKIPKLVAVLVGMVPVTVDVTVRVVGQAAVFTFAPIVGGIGMFVKFVAVEVLVIPQTMSKMNIDITGTRFMNWFGGISSPAIVFGKGKFGSGSKDAMRKYYAINRIIVSSIVLAELAITYTRAYHDCSF